MDTSPTTRTTTKSSNASLTIKRCAAWLKLKRVRFAKLKTLANKKSGALYSSAFSNSSSLYESSSCFFPAAESANETPSAEAAGPPLAAASSSSSALALPAFFLAAINLFDTSESLG